MNKADEWKPTKFWHRVIEWFVVGLGIGGGLGLFLAVFVAALIKLEVGL